MYTIFNILMNQGKANGMDMVVKVHNHLLIKGRREEFFPNLAWETSDKNTIVKLDV